MNSLQFSPQQINILRIKNQYTNLRFVMKISKSNILIQIFYFLAIIHCRLKDYIKFDEKQPRSAVN